VASSASSSIHAIIPPPCPAWELASASYQPCRREQVAPASAASGLPANLVAGWSQSGLCNSASSSVAGPLSCGFAGSGGRDRVSILPAARAVKAALLEPVGLS
jgi:hypothetical protein